MCQLREEKGEIVCLAVLSFVDQVSKAVALKAGVAVLNPGISFGFLTKAGLWLPAFIFLILTLTGFRKSGVKFILLGGFLNLLDRIFRGGAVDFINLSFIPVFNLADVFIVWGFGLVLVDLFKKETLS